MDANEWNQKYGGMSIEQICAQLYGKFASMRESQREFYDILEYLRITGRFKELAGYKKESFWKFLGDNFNIRPGTYRECVRAWTKYPEFTSEFGVGLVAKIERVCGMAKLPKVIAAIQKEKEGRKKALPRAKIEAIIQSFRKPDQVRVKQDWKIMYEREAVAHEKTKDALRAAMAEIHDLSEQIERLKRTAETFSNIRAIFDQYNQFTPTEARA